MTKNAIQTEILRVDFTFHSENNTIFTPGIYALEYFSNPQIFQSKVWFKKKDF